MSYAPDNAHPVRLPRSSAVLVPQPPRITTMTMLPLRSARSLARWSPLALLIVAAACVDDGSAPPTGVRPPGANGMLGALQCEVQVASGEMACVDASGMGGAPASLSPVDGPAREQHTIGSQGTLLRLSNTGNNLAGGIYSLDVTVQNLANLAMATTDGSVRHDAGVQVFFSTLPTVTGGSGNITVANPTGTAIFTAPDQPYYQYGGSISGVEQGDLGADGILASAETSSAKTWQFAMDATVERFGFVVYVRTEAAPGALATIAPQVSDIAVPALVPGDTVTLTGINFAAAFGDNTVRIGGQQAQVIAGGATSLDVVVPCVASGAVGVQVTQGGMTGVALQRTVQVPQRTLNVGESVMVTDVGEVGCNEIMPSGSESRYLVAVYNAGTSPTSSVGIQISGDPAAAEGVLAGPAPSSSVLMAPAALGGALAPVTDEQRHWQLLEGNRREYDRLRARFANDRRMRASRDVVNRDPVEPPVTRTFHVANINTGSFCSNYYVASGTRVYYGGKVAIYEDDNTPAGLKASANATMQDYYNRIGDQFNADMEPIIRNNFGDPLRRDETTDNNGVLVAFFTPLINNNFSNVAGFVVSCDQFPDDDAAEPAVGGPYTPTPGSTNGASNFGEVFYAYQPTSTGTGFGTVGTADYWYRTIRSTFIHETKHVASQAARVANGTLPYEQSWLEEGTARHAEELWMRNAVDGVAWKANTGYGTMANPINVYCDVRPSFAECLNNPRRPASIMQRHFTSLYTHFFGTNARLLSPFGPTPSDNNAYFYAVSWSLVRYTIDRYGVSDADFLTNLTQSSTNGVTNLAAQAGVPIDQLLGGWALSLAADDYPELASPGADIQMPTWNFRSIYAGLNTDFPGTYTLSYPLQPTSLTLGTAFAPVNTTIMYGGGVLWYQLSGEHTEPQLIRLRGNGGAALSSNVRIAIARVQ